MFTLQMKQNIKALKQKSQVGKIIAIIAALFTLLIGAGQCKLNVAHYVSNTDNS